MIPSFKTQILIDKKHDTIVFESITFHIQKREKVSPLIAMIHKLFTVVSYLEFLKLRNPISSYLLTMFINNPLYPQKDTAFIKLLLFSLLVLNKEKIKRKKVFYRLLNKKFLTLAFIFHLIKISPSRVKPIILKVLVNL